MVYNVYVYIECNRILYVLGKACEHKTWILTLAYILWDVRDYICKIYPFYIMMGKLLYCNYCCVCIML